MCQIRNKLLHENLLPDLLESVFRSLDTYMYWYLYPH